MTVLKQYRTNIIDREGAGGSHPERPGRFRIAWRRSGQPHPFHFKRAALYQEAEDEQVSFALPAEYATPCLNATSKLPGGSHEGKKVSI